MYDQNIHLGIGRPLVEENGILDVVEKRGFGSKNHKKKRQAAAAFAVGTFAAYGSIAMK